MSSLEKKIYMILLVSQSGWYFAPNLWRLMNESKTSFMSDFYWTPLALLVAITVYFIVFNWAIYDTWKNKKSKA